MTSKLGRYSRLFPEGPGRAECACDDGVPCLAHFGMLDLQGQIDARRLVGIDKGDSSKEVAMAQEEVQEPLRPRSGVRKKRDVPHAGRF